MGNAHATVTNKSNRSICIITFNNPELLYLSYQNLYVVEPGTSCVVEAMPDPVGLKMGVIVGTSLSPQELIYQRFQCKNEAIFNISEIVGEDISFYGDVDPLGKGKLKESESVPFDMASATIKMAGGIKKKAPAKAPQSAPVDSSSRSNSSSNNKNSVKNGGNGNSKPSSGSNAPPTSSKRPDTASAPARVENQNPKGRIKNSASDASLNSRTNSSHDNNDNNNSSHSIVPRGIEETFEKVSSAFGNLDSKLKEAAAKLDPNYKQRESNAAAEREQTERENRAKLDLEKKLAAEKWNAELRRVKDEKRVIAEGDAEKAAIKTLLRLLKGSEEQDEAEAASEQVQFAEEQAMIEARQREKRTKDKKKEKSMNEGPVPSSNMKKKSMFSDDGKMSQPQKKIESKKIKGVDSDTEINEKKKKKNSDSKETNSKGKSKKIKDEDSEDDNQKKLPSKSQSKSKNVPYSGGDINEGKKKKGKSKKMKEEESDESENEPPIQKKKTGKGGTKETVIEYDDEEDDDGSDDDTSRKKNKGKKGKSKSRRASTVSTTCDATPCIIS